LVELSDLAKLPPEKKLEELKKLERDVAVARTQVENEVRRNKLEEIASLMTEKESLLEVVEDEIIREKVENVDEGVVTYHTNVEDSSYEEESSLYRKAEEKGFVRSSDDEEDRHKDEDKRFGRLRYE